MTARFSGGGKEPEETGIDAPTNGNNQNGNGNGNGNSNGGSNGGGVSEGWSAKYKKSIDCNNPKGFSQKAHCQGRKKMNVKEEGLRDWFGKSSGTTKSGKKKKGWVQVGGKYDGKPCARQPGQETTPKCVSSAKRRSMSKDERDSARRRKVAADPGQPQKTGAAAPTMVSTDPKKKMKEAMEVNEAKDKKGKGSGTKDACYHKVKSRYSVWPSAYASGALVKCRKVGAANWGNSTKKESYELSNWRDDFKATEYEFIDLIKPEPLKGETLEEKKAQKCWPGYEKKGTKKMFGKTYNNCVKKEETEIEEKKDPCWDTHKQVGMKKKGGKMVPNCVPKEEKQIGGGNLKKLAGKATKRVDADIDGDVDTKDMKSSETGEFVPSPCGKKKLKPKVRFEQSDWRSDLGEDWQKVNKSDNTDGMSQKAVNAYRRENPGSKLKTAVTGNPKKGSKDAKRRSSYCSRSEGQKKMHNIDCTKTPDKAICKARRRWKC